MQIDNMDPRKKALVDAMGGSEPAGGLQPLGGIGLGKSQTDAFQAEADRTGDLARERNVANAGNNIMSAVGGIQSGITPNQFGAMHPPSPVPGASNPQAGGAPAPSLPGTNGVPATPDPAPSLGMNGPDAGGLPGPADYTKRGKFATFNAGADDKYNRPWDQLSERYKMQTILSNFDPNQGITPEVIAALNKANINGATFSGGKDKLDARGLQNWENYDGREGIGDIIKGLNDPNMAGKHEWGAWQPEGDAPQRAEMPAGGGGRPSFGGSTINSSLQGNAQDDIQAALAQLQGRSPNIQELIKQLGGVA